VLVWTAYSRREKRIIAFNITNAANQAIESCIKVYNKIKELGKKVALFCSDGNSCYDVAYAKYLPEEKLIMTKSQTHLIESSNSSIRDNLKRFNRRTKGYSKTIEMLQITMDLFINRDLLGNLNRVF